MYFYNRLGNLTANLVHYPYLVDIHQNLDYQRVKRILPNHHLYKLYTEQKHKVMEVERQK